MPDLLNVAVSGLRAFQRALETTSHNIANVSTPGYSRQRVELVTSEPEIFGSAALGTGVVVGSVRRFSSDLLLAQSRQAASGFARLDVYAQKASTLSNLFADSATGLSASLQRFTSALQDVANTPTATSARQVLLAEAQGLRTRFETYESRLDSLDAEINDQLRGEATLINSIAANVARLNQDIMSASAMTGNPPADLLDARDQQLAQLAARLDVTTVPQDGGTINVFVGNGQPLVLGTQSSKMVAQADLFDATRVTLAFQTDAGAVDVSGSLSGGSVGGLLDARRELIDPARNELGRIAAGIVQVTNEQHRKGVDLRGVAGGDFFAIGGVEVLRARTNGGTATLAATRTDAAALATNDYVLRHQGGGTWSVLRADTGAVVPFTTTGATLQFDGLAVTISGTANTGDRFLLRPTAAAIGGLTTLVSDPAMVAAAAPVRTATTTGNAGTGSISAGEVLDAGNAALLGTVTLRFTSANAWEARNASNAVVGTGSYTPGGNIDVNGWRVQVDGAPAAGDTFTVSSNTAGVGDNRNALAMVSALGRGLFSGGTESLHGAVDRFVGTVGVATASANTSLEAQTIMRDDAAASVDALSGVNLDEEAANMLRYQQAYQAAAQMIRVTQQLMDTLLNAVQR